MRRLAGQPRGFTLIELLLVLAVMALLVALAAPSMRGWSKGAKLRDASDRLAAATQFARAQAAITAQVHLLEVNDSGASFRITARTPEGDEPAAGEFAGAVTVDGHLRLRIQRLDGTEGPIAFYPNGRVTPAIIHIDADWGQTQALAAPTPAAVFRATVDGGTL